jgi:hypothetical protein
VARRTRATPWLANAVADLRLFFEFTIVAWLVAFVLGPA